MKLKKPDFSLVALFLAHMCCYWAGLQFDFVYSEVSMLWMPTGFTLAAAANFGFKAILVCGTAAFSANILSSGSLSFSFFAFLANVSEGLLLFLVIQCFPQFSCNLKRLKDVGIFAFFGLILAPLSGALIGSLGLFVVRGYEGILLWDAGFQWWLGDFVGGMVFGPFLLLLMARKRNLKKKLIESAVFLAVFTGLFLGLSWLEPRQGIAFLILTLLPFPLTVWASLKQGVFGAASGNMLISVALLFLAVSGKGPFAYMDSMASMIYTAVFIGMTTLTTLGLGGLIEEREEGKILLQHQTHLLRQALDTLPGAVWRLNARNEIQWVNQRAVQLMQNPPKGYLGMHILSLWPGNSAALIEHLGQNTECGWEEDVLHPRGKPVRFFTSSAPFPDEMGEDAGRLLLSMDITDRKEAEERFRLLFEQSEAPHLILSHQLKILECNAAALNILGYTDSLEMTGHNLSQFCSRELLESQTWEQGYLAAAFSPSRTRFECFHLKKDGTRVPVEVMISPVFWESQQTLLVVWNDLMSVKLNEEILMRARDDAEKANRTKSEFLAMMSHEMRTPLNGILGFAHLLSEQVSENEREYLDVIQSSARSLLSVITQLLDYSQMESGSMRMRMAIFSPERMVSEVLSRYQPEIQTKALEFALEMDPALPRRMSGDRDRVAQVLSHLLSNAVKFTSQGFIRLTVGFREEGVDRFIHYEVEDSGIGIDAELHGMVFARFFQEDSASNRSFDGMGLGLAISRNLVEMMHGRIGFESIKHKGSRFWFELPLGEEIEVEEELEEDFHLFKKPLKILLVEDDRDCQALLLRWLDQFGCRVELAVNGAEAVVQCQNRYWDLVLMDCQIPELDGYESTRIIRDLDGKHAEVPVVGITGDLSSFALEAARECGMQEILHKPFRREGLKDVLVRLLGPGSESDSDT